MKKVFFIFTLVIIGITGGIFYIKIQKPTVVVQGSKSTAKTDSAAIEDLVILPQIPQHSVEVKSATLSKNGFVVVREIDDGKVSQVIEMSKPLKKGENKDITISLGSVDVASKELAVMLYEDYANDGIFNDLDMPALNENGLTTARFAKTGKPLPESMTETDIPAMNMAGMKSMVKVRYTDKGFVPEKIEVKTGDMIEFINESSSVMWVASMPHPAHTDLPTFDQFKTLKKGAIYRYIFDKKGTWGYHDHINPSRGGVVTVL